MPMERTLLDLWVQDVVLVCLDTASHYPVGGQGISEGFFSLFLRQISIQCISTACPSSWASFCHLDASSNRAADLENKFSISERMSQLERTQASFSITVSIFHFQMPVANGIVWMGWLMWQLHMWTCTRPHVLKVHMDSQKLDVSHLASVYWMWFSTNLIQWKMNPTSNIRFFCKLEHH